MIRLLRDRYFAYDQVQGCDLATGDAVRLDDLPQDEDSPLDPELAPLAEVLDDGRDGEPRWISAEMKRSAATVRRVAALARRKGFVPMLVDVYDRFADRLAEDLGERALLLIAHAATDVPAARSALMRAAACSRRPHVLVTFGSASSDARGCVVREARATYGVPAARLPARGQVGTADVARHLERASRAPAFQAAGRHASAERLLRDVAAALVRRDATAPAARTLVTLARMLLERGRAADAESACDEAARLADAGQDEQTAISARLWQVTARTEAGRLPDAESLCRAVLLAGALSPGQAAWARALLARTLRWQKRVEEAVRLDATDTESETHEAVDAATSTYVAAAMVRRHLDAGDVFEAGIRARALVERTGDPGDPLVAIIVDVAYLRVLCAMGDLTLAEQRLTQIIDLAARAHTPLRGVRARLVWHDALRRAPAGPG